MTVLVTAASGELGHLVVERLLARGAAPADVRAGARTPERAARLADRGVEVVPLDYDDPTGTAAALDGVDRVLLISGTELGERAAQHRAVIDAAVAARVSLLAYTSLSLAGTSSLPIAPSHLATERAITASEVPATVLRNNWYAENYLRELRRAAETGELPSATGDGKVAPASRVDYADAAAAVLLGEGHAGRTYELAGDTALTYEEIAVVLGEVLGREVVHRRASVAEIAGELEAAGLDAGLITFLTALDRGIAAGDLDVDDRALADLIGRPTTPLAEVLRADRDLAGQHQDGHATPSHHRCRQSP